MCTYSTPLLDTSVFSLLPDIHPRLPAPATVGQATGPGLSAGEPWGSGPRDPAAALVGDAICCGARVVVGCTRSHCTTAACSPERIHTRTNTSTLHCHTNTHGQTNRAKPALVQGKIPRPALLRRWSTETPAQQSAREYVPLSPSCGPARLVEMALLMHEDELQRRCELHDETPSWSVCGCH